MFKKADIGIIIGRFQVVDLHYGHIKFICDVMDRHREVVIFLGVTSAKGTIENPLDFETREQMILKQFPNIKVVPLPDCKTDKEWSKKLDHEIYLLLENHIINGNTFCLYGGRNSFIKHYKGIHTTYEFESKHHHAGTLVRLEAGKCTEDNSSFRHGIIYSTQNQWPKVYPTVDIAVIRIGKVNKSSVEYEVLLGKKKSSSDLHFPGGFVDPTDLSYEDAALREVKEETDLDISKSSLKYISSHFINDYRYQGRDKIITSFYLSTISYHDSVAIKPNDDLIDIGWHSINSVRVTENHKILLENLKNYINNNEELYE